MSKHRGHHGGPTPQPGPAHAVVRVPAGRAENDLHDRRHRGAEQHDPQINLEIGVSSQQRGCDGADLAAVAGAGPELGGTHATR
jgi:hypothetical protein